ncbi:MAG: TerB family tellurite resistance protein [Candidatus Riflebacteria bacterium]|nr:TerB family tellurite resistance protein [Candidatus Riflebacteria bacterium]
MAWGTNLLNGILGALFGDDAPDGKKNDDAKFGYSRPCGHTSSSKFRYDPLGDDIPEGHYERESESSQKPQQNRDEDNFKKSSQTSYSQKTQNRQNTQQSSYSQQNRQSQQSRYSQQNNYSQQKKSYYSYDEVPDDYDYDSNETFYDADDDTGDPYYGNSSDYLRQSQGSQSSYSYSDKTNLKKDKSAKASQGFRRQHATKSRPGEKVYPTLSSKNSRYVANDRASFTFGDPHFSTYDHGVRGIAFPYSLKVKNPRNRRIVVSGKFCSKNGAWIKSLVPEMADMYGDLVINESVFCIDDTFCVDSYLFVPYGVLSLKFTQKIYLNIDVFVDGEGPQHLIRYVYGFEYYIYENDPRESVYTSTSSTSSSSTFSNNKTGLDELIGLVAHVIKADGVCAPQEVRAVIDFFKKFQDVDKDYLKDRLKFKLSNPSNLENDCQVLKEAFNTQTRLVFLGLFFKIAVSDESIPKVELDLIERISDRMGIPKSSFSALSMDFLPASDKIWHIFGLTSKATKEQLKSAYRVKCKECHPDRFANASKEEYKKAEERFKELQDMYNFLLRKYSNL